MHPLLQRKGARPTTAESGPHAQLTDQSSPEIWNSLISEALNFPHVIEGRSSVSMATTRALLFDDKTTILNPETSLSPHEPLEPVHIHDVTDTSLHMCLPKERTEEVCELGWGERHPFADFDTQIMVYGPRDAEELRLVLELVKESLSYARQEN